MCDNLNEPPPCGPCRSQGRCLPEGRCTARDHSSENRCRSLRLPCETYSIADLSNVIRGNHYRDHPKKHKPPRRDAGKKRDTALAHDTLVRNIIQAWACDAEQGSNAELLLENPVGNLQHRPFVHCLPSALDMIRRRADYCAYNHIFKKPNHMFSTQLKGF